MIGLLAGIDEVPVLFALGGASPKFRTPFSVWKIACRPGGWNLATISGKPMPRLT